MSAPRPLEVERLAKVQKVLDEFAVRFGRRATEARFQALEAAATRMGTHDLAQFHRVFERKTITALDKLNAVGALLVVEIEKTGIPPALALSALAREQLETSEQKNTGAYHTDFRLAQRLAELAAAGLNEHSRVLDPACGAGILLTALTMKVCGADRRKTAQWLRHSVCAADMSANALRGALISLAALTDDIDALVTMHKRWIVGDSLMVDAHVWDRLAPGGFTCVIANPPWEKVKLNKHEYLKSQGHDRHYGSDTVAIDGAAFKKQRDAVASYGQLLVKRFPVMGKGEPDLYMAFLELNMQLLRPGGRAAILVPGGLIRSQGTETIRRKIFHEASEIEISILDNKARFFAIDTRFKFVALAITKISDSVVVHKALKLSHEHGTDEGVEISHVARIGRAKLAQIRGDLSIPEVKSAKEWKLFCKLSSNGSPMNLVDSPWYPEFCREVDMTSGRSLFYSVKKPATLPVIEGRHIQQHRFGVKQYVSGSGRAAVWHASDVGVSRVVSQFYYPTFYSTPKTVARMSQIRAGFCDIAGQTNERSMMAALIPEGVVCGNKVPTVLFPNDPGRERLLVWLAVVNSFAFDWMLRRVLTTTINYFVLLGLSMPNVAKGGLPWRRLVNHASELIELDTAGASEKNWSRMSWLRTQIDVEVALAYGLNHDDLALILQDFPLLDGAQPILPGERRSTLTRDMLMAEASRRLREPDMASQWLARVKLARQLEAHAYMPTEVGRRIERRGVNRHDRQ